MGMMQNPDGPLRFGLRHADDARVFKRLASCNRGNALLMDWRSSPSASSCELVNDMWGFRKMTLSKSTAPVKVRNGRVMSRAGVFPRNEALLTNGDFPSGWIAEPWARWGVIS